MQLRTILTDRLYAQRFPYSRYFALWYFATLLTLWNVAGQWFLGFEASPLQLAVGVGTACLMQWLLDWLVAVPGDERRRFGGNLFERCTFFLPAIISGLAVAMLLYPNERIAPIAFAACLAITSKGLFRAPMKGGGHQHIFNPSNLGITVTLVLLPWVGLAPPYQFTENLHGWQNWALVTMILGTGIFVHGMFTGRLTLCIAWILSFLLQALFRSQYFHVPIYPLLAPMTSAAFILFTLYMIPDPATTPVTKRGQLAFGVSVATLYAVAIMSHFVIGLFLALFMTSLLRGGALWVAHWMRSTIISSIPLRSVAMNKQVLK